MRIGDYEIKWDGNCYVVGKPVKRRSSKGGSDFTEIKGAKYHPRLGMALDSLGDRLTAEAFAASQDWSDFKDRLRELAESIEAPLRNAVERAGEAGESGPEMQKGGILPGES